MRRRVYLMSLLAISALLLAGLYVVFRSSTPTVQSAAAGVPHADHAARHGGVFFMAPDGFHHLEGTLQGNEFRLYFYDNLTRPADARKFLARVGARPLVPDARGEYLKLTLNQALVNPVKVTATVRFRPDGAEQIFDFTF